MYGICRRICNRCMQPYQSFADERSARPAWLDKVEIHVDAKGANGTVMQTFDRAGVDAPVPVGSGVRGDSNDRSGAGDVLQNRGLRKNPRQKLKRIQRWSKKQKPKRIQSGKRNLRQRQNKKPNLNKGQNRKQSLRQRQNAKGRRNGDRRIP